MAEDSEALEHDEVTRHIRVVALALCRVGDRLLIEHGHDAVTGETFYRAIGGGVEFGERAVDALAREFREEYGLALEAPLLRGVLESRFTFQGRAGHEIVFVFEASLPDSAWDGGSDRRSIDSDGNEHHASWITLEALRQGDVPMKPLGVLELLENSQA